MTSSYLLRPLRSMEQVRREREEQGRTATGAWLPWEDIDATPSMYIDEETKEERFGPTMPGKME